MGFFRDRPQHVFVVDVPVDGERPATLPEPVPLTAGDVGVSGVRWLPSGDGLVAVSSRHTSRESDLRSDVVRIDAEGAPGVRIRDRCDSDVVGRGVPGRPGDGDRRGAD